MTTRNAVYIAVVRCIHSQRVYRKGMIVIE